MTAIGRSRAIRRTFAQGSGVALDRATTLSAFTVVAVNQDCIVNLRDGGASGAIYWVLEADNGASSPTAIFNPPIKFFTNIYMEFVTGGSESSASIAVIEK